MEDNNATIVFEKITVPEIAQDAVRDRQIQNIQNSMGKNQDCSIDEYLNAAGCGIRPLCAFTAACKKKTAAWQDCVNKSTDTKAAVAQSTADFNQQALSVLQSSGAVGDDGKLSTGAWIGIGVFGLALIGAVAYVVLKRRS